MSLYFVTLHVSSLLITLVNAIFVREREKQTLRNSREADRHKGRERWRESNRMKREK